MFSSTEATYSSNVLKALSKTAIMTAELNPFVVVLESSQFQKGHRSLAGLG
jgi:hypothetical protein